MSIRMESGTVDTNRDIEVFSNVKQLPGEHRTTTGDTISQGYLDRQAASESNARSYPRKLPFALAQAKGIYIKDVDGNVYYDCLSGAGAIALGHNHTVVQDAIRTELDNNLPMLTLDITTPIKEEFVKEILSCFPEEFAKNAKVQFCGPSGADAVEAAIKLVKIATGRRSMAAFHGGYHGMTHGALSMMGNLGSKNLIPGLMSDVHFLPFPYNYRSPMGDVGVDPDVACSNYIDTVLTDDESGVTKPAGIIVEAVQGEGGKIPAPDAWMVRLRKITKEQGIPLIIDEIQSGLGRTGKMFAFEHSGIIPDVVVLSKAIGGAQPLAVVVYNKELDVWGPGAHAGTFRGNQLGMAAGIATIKFIKENKLADNAAKMGELFKTLLSGIQADTKCIGDIRGRGLMLGVEIVNPLSGILQSGKPERFEKLARRIQFECFSRGLIIEIGGRQSSVLRFLPPLIITEEQVKHICSIFKEAVIAAEDTMMVSPN
ncbi:MAG: diaminobutyrate aminotransferase apoenzyme [Flavipsychrobacter sp.]|nr:diaminobutyrate aminotransferase apoenzyme [Flavipsychrobacter sp.]